MFDDFLSCFVLEYVGLINIAQGCNSEPTPKKCEKPKIYSQPKITVKQDRMYFFLCFHQNVHNLVYIYIFQCWFNLNQADLDWLIPSLTTELAPTLVLTPPTGCSSSLSSRSRLASTFVKKLTKLSSSVKSLFFRVRSP